MPSQKPAQKTKATKSKPGSVFARVTPELAELVEAGIKRIKSDRDVRRLRIEFSRLTIYAKLEKHVGSAVSECLDMARRRKQMKRKRRPKPAAPVAETGEVQ